MKLIKKVWFKLLERLIDFCHFLGVESFNLQNYANDVTNFSIQQAWNFSKTSPVGIAANNYQRGSYSWPFFKTTFHLVQKRKVKNELLKVFMGINILL